MEELVAQQKEWQELRKKKEAWNETKQHQKTLLEFKHKKEALEKENELSIGVGNRDKCNRQNVCENHTNQIHVCSKRISQTKGKRRKRTSSLGHFDNTKGKAYLTKTKLDD